MQNNRSHQSSLYSNKTISYLKTLIILGESEVGKSTMLKVLTKQKFDTIYQTTIGLNYYVKEYEFSKNEKLTFSIWDTSGIEIKEKILPLNQYKKCDYFLILLSYDNKETLDSLHNYLNFISQHHDSRTTPILIIINKGDLKIKEFTIKTVMKKVEEYNMINISVCDLSCQNIKAVDLMFHRIGAILCGKKLHTGSIASSNYAESLAETNSDSMMVPLRRSFKIEENDGTVNSLSNLLCNVSGEGKKKSKKCCN